MATALRKFVILPDWHGADVPVPAERNRLVPSNKYRHVRRAAIDTFVVHATAGGSSSGAMSVPLGGKNASWHWLIPDEDEAAHGQYVWRCVPDSGAAWHVLSQVPHPMRGPGTINDRSFGVEVVNAQNGRDPFSDWQLRATAGLVRYAWSRYGVKYLFTHSYLDPHRKSDPTSLFNWDLFVDYVMAGQTIPADPTVQVNGVVVPCEAEWCGDAVTVEAAPVLAAMQAPTNGAVHRNGRAFLRELVDAAGGWSIAWQDVPPVANIKRVGDGTSRAGPRARGAGRAATRQGACCRTLREPAPMAA
ncbi:MAG TPA: peptidoglycan recognition family protein [Planctomycetota bacterium]|nr:peptidoglycan recognition family protein [Planctomycetota bacterium]